MNPKLLCQPTWPRNLAAVALCVVAYFYGCWALAVAPALVALLVARLRWSGRHINPEGDTESAPPFAACPAWVIFVLLPERYAFCECCGGFVDLWAAQ
jgi:hypothetical protein